MFSIQYNNFNPSNLKIIWNHDNFSTQQHLSSSSPTTTIILIYFHFYLSAEQGKTLSPHHPISSLIILLIFFHFHLSAEWGKTSSPHHPISSLIILLIFFHFHLSAESGKTSSPHLISHHSSHLFPTAERGKILSPFTTIHLLFFHFNQKYFNLKIISICNNCNPRIWRKYQSTLRYHPSHFHSLR